MDGTKLALAVLLSLATPAAAAEFKLSPDGSTITMTGKIGPGDAVAFLPYADKAKPGAKVVLISEGGNVVGSRNLGNVIRSLGYSTHVPAGKRCVSGCALAWLGGVTRSIGARASVGFHGPYNPDTMEPTQAGRNVVREYVLSLGMSKAAASFAQEAGPHDFLFLTPKRAKRYGIAVTFNAP
jgi:hypothetical protein